MSKFDIRPINDGDVIRHTVSSSSTAFGYLTFNSPWWFRCIEWLFALISFVSLLPLILILMAIIRLESPGPSLFVQNRISRYGQKPFRFAKLRTMYTDAATRFPDLCSYSFNRDEVGEVKLSVKDDPRVTPFGKWLRRTSLDELPNFWNVLTGEMALVGPRPEMWSMLEYYDARTMRKFDVLPGITGFAQISGRGDLTFDETVELDLAYVTKKSVMTDLQVLCQTVGCTLARKGAF